MIHISGQWNFIVEVRKAKNTDDGCLDISKEELDNYIAFTMMWNNDPRDLITSTRWYSMQYQVRLPKQ